MQVILQKDIPGIGKKGEVKNVKEGYGRNYLIAQGFAVQADAVLLHNIQHANQAKREHEEHEKERVKNLARELKDVVLTATVKAGKEGSVFGSVGPAKIIELLREKGFDLDKSNISLDHPLKILGTHTLPVKLPYGFSATVTLDIQQAP